MSRWADAFAALSEATDTRDTVRHLGGQALKVSQSVDSVIAPMPVVRADTAVMPPAADRAHSICGDAEGERAAIVEYDGNVPRAWAEGFARLDPDRPPRDMPPKRWPLFVNDVGLFLDGPFCSLATTFGWGPYDLFGCDRDRPFTRIDQAGLLWLLGGDKLVALSEGAAGIETRIDGQRLTYRRRPAEPGRVLAWELMQ